MNIPITSVQGLKYAYTRPFKEPLSANPVPSDPSGKDDNWLKEEPFANDYTPVYPDLESIYFVRDYYSMLNKVELTYGGKRLHQMKKLSFLSID